MVSRILRIGLPLVFLLGQATAALAQNSADPKEALLVLSKGNHTLSIVDPATLKVVASMPSGDDPHEVACDDDGKIAYVTNYGTGRGGYNTLTVADLVTLTLDSPRLAGATRTALLELGLAEPSPPGSPWSTTWRPGVKAQTGRRAEATSRFAETCAVPTLK